MVPLLHTARALIRAAVLTAAVCAFAGVLPPVPQAGAAGPASIIRPEAKQGRPRVCQAPTLRGWLACQQLCQDGRLRPMDLVAGPSGRALTCDGVLEDRYHPWRFKAPAIDPLPELNT